MAPRSGGGHPHLLDRTTALDIGDGEGLAGFDANAGRHLPTLSEVGSGLGPESLSGHTASSLFAGEILGTDRAGLGRGKSTEVTEVEAKAIKSVHGTELEECRGRC